MSDELRFHSFPQHCVLGSRLALPETDVLGARSGAAYCHRDHLCGYVLQYMGWLPSIRGGDVSHVRGIDAWRLAFVFLVCPYAIDWRTYVPVYRNEAARRAGKPEFYLEWVLTVERTAHPGVPHLHAIHLAPISERRLARLHSLGTTTERITLDAVPRQTRLNAMWCFARLVGRQVDPFERAARELADYLNRSTAHGTLRQRLWRARRHVSHRDFVQHPYQILATAVIKGFVRLDHRFPLDMDDELRLLKDEGGA